MAEERDVTGRISPGELAQNILRERDVIKKHFEDVAELKQRVVRYEVKFDMPSNQIHAAIDRGDLIETDEVCDWILTYEALERSNALTSGR